MALNILKNQTFLYETPTEESCLIEVNAQGIYEFCPAHALLKECFDQMYSDLQFLHYGVDYKLGDAIDYPKENVIILFTQQKCPRTFGGFDKLKYEQHCIEALKESVSINTTNALAIHQSSPMLELPRVRNYLEHLAKTLTINIYGG